MSGMPAAHAPAGRPVFPALATGEALAREGRFGDAEAPARRAVQIAPDSAAALHLLGHVRRQLGDAAEARTLLERALALDPGHRPARRELALLLIRSGDWLASLPLVSAEFGEDGQRWFQAQVSAAMAQRDLHLAGELSRVGAALQRGSTHWPAGAPAGLVLPSHEKERRITDGALSHDIDQFEYLIARGIFGSGMRTIVDRYRAILDRRAAARETRGVPLAPEDQAAIGAVYNRILHVRPTPRMDRALSDCWDPQAVEDRYLGQEQGVVVIDDFLAPDTLRELRAFCLESTFWHANRYGHGRLGALFHQGFNCPLLLQIAEEIRAAFPRMIGDRHTLRQMWGFKNAPFQPGNSTTHADFAAVNVNFWITPEEANLAPDRGGLIIYDVDAPRHWDFHTYNGRADVIRPFLVRQKARELVVPYRQNRAIIFNSDLFHCTDEVRFSPEYENRRINVTMLYGVRAEDGRRLNKPDPLTDPGHQAWRSHALRGRMRR